MNTPSHLLLGVAVFGRSGHAKITTAAVLGGLAPDISLYVMSAWAMLVQNVPAEVVFREYYFSGEWMRVFALDNSFILWGALFGLGLWSKRAWVIAFAGAGLLHLATDFTLHHYDARPHFWPLTNWVFQSPISYWDGRFYGRIFAPIELVLDIGLCVVLWGKYKGRWARRVIGVMFVVLILLAALWALSLIGVVPFGH